MLCLKRTVTVHDLPGSDYSDVLANTQAALVMSRADIARLQTSLQRAKDQVAASRVVLNAAYKTLEVEPVQHLLSLRGL